MTGVAVREDGIRGLAHGVVDRFMDEMNRPAFRAGLGVTMASTIVLAKLGARPWVTIIAATMLGVTAERLYGMAEDIHARLDGGYAPGKD